MPSVLASGIVTRYANYKESDRIISIFTVEHGRVDAKARGCRRPTSPLLQCAQPFVYGVFELYFSHERYTVNNCEVKESFFPIREDIARFGIGSAMLQLAQEAVQENEPNEALFSLLYHGLSFLAYGQSEPDDLLCCFLLRFLQATGFCPSIARCAICGRDVRADGALYFDVPGGGTVCAACRAQARPVSKLALEALRRMLLLPVGELDRVRLTSTLRGELLPLLIDYAEERLQYGAKALSFLKSVQ